MRRVVGLCVPLLAVSILLLALQVSFAGGANELRMLRSDLQVQRFILPPGATRVVPGDLHIESAGDIRIGGTLLVPPGASVQLHAGRDLIIDGRIDRMGPIPLAKPKPHVRGPHLDEYQASRRFELEGTITGVPGQSIKVATAEFGSIDISGRILIAPGHRALTQFEDGQRGGSIILGGLLGPNERITIGEGAVLRAGAGGDGFNDRAGDLNGKPNSCQDESGNRETLHLIGTHGGKGGSIRLMADQLSVQTDNVTAGRGGRGGDAGGPRVFAPDGKGRIHGGADVYAVSGEGGTGGAMFQETKNYSGATLKAAAGGDAGDIAAGAGDGAFGCDGGRTMAALRRPGKNGRDQGPAVEAPGKSGKPGTIRLAHGGNGGPGKRRGEDGGDGGRVSIEVAGRTKKEGKGPLFVRDVSLGGYANGGLGYSTCGLDFDAPGTDGGRGGDLSIPAVSYKVSGSFSGKDGGNGEPPGDGGRAGTAKNPASSASGSFLSGKNGERCNIEGTGTIARGGCEDPLCVTVTVTFNRPFKAFRIQLPRDYGEGNIAPPYVEGREAGTCVLRPLTEEKQVTTVCTLNAEVAPSTQVSVGFLAFRFNSSDPLPSGAGGDLYYLPPSINVGSVAGPFKLTGP